MAEPVGLTRWFKERWVDLGRPKEGGGYEDCGRPDASEGKYPKCVPASRAGRMTPDEIKSAVRRKRRAETEQQRESKKPINVSTYAKHAEHDQKAHGSWARGDASVALSNQPPSFSNFTGLTPGEIPILPEVQAAQKIAAFLVSQGVTEEEMVAAGFAKPERLQAKRGPAFELAGSYQAAAVIDLMYQWSSASGGDSVHQKIRRAVVEELGGHQDEQTSPWGQELWAGEWESIKRPWLLVARAMYDETQRLYRELGKTHLILYRGVTRPDKKNDLSDLIGNTPAGGYREFEYFGSALTSWSWLPSTARLFSSYVIGARVPIENIFSVPSTGLGTSSEAEAVVINRQSGDRAIMMFPSTVGDEDERWKAALTFYEKTVKSWAGVDKHAPGQHDQKSHGKWADGITDDDLQSTAAIKANPLRLANPGDTKDQLGLEADRFSRRLAAILLDVKEDDIDPDAANSIKTFFRQKVADRMAEAGVTEDDMRYVAETLLSKMSSDKFSGIYAETLTRNFLGRMSLLGRVYQKKPLGPNDALDNLWAPPLSTSKDKPTLARFIQGLNTVWERSSEDVLSVGIKMMAEMQLGADGETGERVKDNTKFWKEAFKDERIAKFFRVFVQAQYDETQAQLERLGAKHVMLVRGVEATSANVSVVRGVYEADIKHRALSSFSSSPLIAQGFGNALILARVPAKDIFSISELGGVGMSSENEFVVINRDGAKAHVIPLPGGGGVNQKILPELQRTLDGLSVMHAVVQDLSKANVPDDPKLYARVKAEAKRKFDVYPSAYANGWLVQEYKRRGGTYSVSKHAEHDQKSHGNWAKYRAEDQRATLAEMDRAGVPVEPFTRRKAGTGISGAGSKQGGKILPNIKVDENGVAVIPPVDAAIAKWGKTYSEVRAKIFAEFGVNVIDGKVDRVRPPNEEADLKHRAALALADALESVRASVGPRTWEAITGAYRASTRSRSAGVLIRESQPNLTIYLGDSGPNNLGTYFPNTGSYYDEGTISLSFNVADSVVPKISSGNSDPSWSQYARFAEMARGSAGSVLSSEGRTSRYRAIFHAVVYATAIHEIGHAINIRSRGTGQGDRLRPISSVNERFSRLPDSPGVADTFDRMQPGVSRYGSSNTLEQYAEAFAYWMLFGRSTTQVDASISSNQNYQGFVRDILPEVIKADAIYDTLETMPSVMAWLRYQADKMAGGVRKHYEHDQKSHGNWARYRAEDQRATLAEMDRAGVPVEPFTRRKAGTGISRAKKPARQLDGLGTIKRDANGVAVMMTSAEATAKYGSTPDEVMRYLDNYHGIKTRWNESEWLAVRRDGLMNDKQALAIFHGAAEGLDMVRSVVTAEAWETIKANLRVVTFQLDDAGQAGSYTPTSLPWNQGFYGVPYWKNEGQIQIVDAGIEEFDLAIASQLFGFTGQPRKEENTSLLYPTVGSGPYLPTREEREASQGVQLKDVVARRAARSYEARKAITLATMIHELGHVADLSIEGMFSARAVPGTAEPVFEGRRRAFSAHTAPTTYGGSMDFEYVAETFAALVLFGKEMKALNRRNARSNLPPGETYGQDVIPSLRDLVIKSVSAILCGQQTMPVSTAFVQYQMEKLVRGVRKHYDHDQKSHGNWARGSGRGVGVTALRSAVSSWVPINDEIRAYLKDKFKVVIPPGYTDVRVHSDWKNGGDGRVVMATDAKGRSVSMYTKQYQDRQKEQKYGRVLELSKVIGKLDAALAEDAMTDDTAAAVLLMRELGMRPGSMADTRAAKQAYGATTLQARHVFLSPTTKTVRFTFVGKKGVNISISTRNPAIWEAISSRMEGKSGKDRLFDTTEGQTLNYVKQHAGSEFMQKDLRTLKAYTMAMKMVKGMRRPTTLAAFKKARLKIGDAVSKQLGNTRAESLSSYIPEFVFDAWLDKLGQDGKDWREGNKR